MSIEQELTIKTDLSRFLDWLWDYAGRFRVKRLSDHSWVNIKLVSPIPELAADARSCSRDFEASYEAHIAYVKVSGQNLEDEIMKVLGNDFEVIFGDIDLSGLLLDPAFGMRSHELASDPHGLYVSYNTPIRSPVGRIHLLELEHDRLRLTITRYSEIQPIDEYFEAMVTAIETTWRDPDQRLGTYASRSAGKPDPVGNTEHPRPGRPSGQEAERNAEIYRLYKVQHLPRNDIARLKSVSYSTVKAVIREEAAKEKGRVKIDN